MLTMQAFLAQQFSFLQVFLTEDGLPLAIVMEYVEGTTLLDHVNSYGKLEEDEAR